MSSSKMTVYKNVHSLEHQEPNYISEDWAERQREKCVCVCVCVCMHVSRFRESQEKGDFVRKEKINKWREWQVMVK